MFFKIGVLKKLAKFRKTSELDSLFNKVLSLISITPENIRKPRFFMFAGDIEITLATLLKKGFVSCFSVNVAKCLRTSFSQSTPRGCFLIMHWNYFIQASLYGSKLDVSFSISKILLQLGVALIEGHV